MSNQNEEMNNELLEAQVESSETVEVVDEAFESKKDYNKRMASILDKQNPDRAREIALERLSKMTPEQIAALRAAKQAKAEADAAAIQAATEAIERKIAEEAAAKQLSPEQKAQVVAQLAKLSPEQLDVVKEKHAAKKEAENAKLNNEAVEVTEADAATVVVPAVAADKKVQKAKPAKAKKASSKRKHSISYESKQAFTGFMFVLPWFIGFLLFFAAPCFQSLRYSFSKVAVFEGYACTWVGLENYKELLTGGAAFLKGLISTFTDLLVNVPIVLIFSLFVAVLINRKFVGRGLVRAIFFLPVIVTTGVVMTTFNAQSDANAVLEGEVNNGVLFEVANATEFLTSLGLNATLTEYMTMVADRIFDVVWDSGIQILLFLAALQGISPSLYEASDVEGATAWETFWLITFPNVAPIILVNIVYTIVDTFSDTDNQVLRQIDSFINASFNFGGAAAASWSFFAVIFAILAVVFLIYKILTKNSD